MRFTEILFTATVITGIIWLYDILFLKRCRMDAKSLSGKEISEPMIVEYSKAFFPILLIVLIVRSFIVEPFRIPSGSMHPTLLEGDFIIVNKYEYGLRVPFTNKIFYKIGEPKRGDVFIFRHTRERGENTGESIDMIKRVIGVPGDHIQYKNNTVYINGNPANQAFIKSTEDKDGAREWPAKLYSETIDDIKHDIYVYSVHLSRRYKYDDIIVPKGSYFAMGDNRDNSDDSRYWGFVSEDDILGKAFGVWMSWDSGVSGWDQLKHSVRWDRIGNSLSTPAHEASESSEAKKPHEHDKESKPSEPKEKQ